jgi:hypothetical protein
MKRSFILLMLLFLSVLGVAQNSNFGNWLIYFGDKKIKEKWNWHHEIQYRNFNFIGDTEQLLLRTGIGYNISEKNNNVLLGYAFIYNEPYAKNSDDKLKFNEHRFYQQFITLQNTSRNQLNIIAFVNF